MLRRRRRLTAGITVDFRNAIPRVGFGIAADGIVVEHAQDLRHLFLPLPPSWLCSCPALPRSEARSARRTASYDGPRNQPRLHRKPTLAPAFFGRALAAAGAGRR